MISLKKYRAIILDKLNDSNSICPQFPFTLKWKEESL